MHDALQFFRQRFSAFNHDITCFATIDCGDESSVLALCSLMHIKHRNLLMLSAGSVSVVPSHKRIQEAIVSIRYGNTNPESGGRFRDQSVRGELRRPSKENGTEGSKDSKGLFVAGGSVGRIV
jgi:hypothetical protein